MTQDQQNRLDESLEPLLDRYSLLEILGSLSRICELKAQHLEEAWQDAASARCYRKAGVTLDNLASHYAIKQVSWEVWPNA